MHVLLSSAKLSPAAVLPLLQKLQQKPDMKHSSMHQTAHLQQNHPHTAYSGHIGINLLYKLQLSREQPLLTINLLHKLHQNHVQLPLFLTLPHKLQQNAA